MFLGIGVGVVFAERYSSYLSLLPISVWITTDNGDGTASLTPPTENETYSLGVVDNTDGTATFTITEI